MDFQVVAQNWNLIQAVEDFLAESAAVASFIFTDILRFLDDEKGHWSISTSPDTQN